jgi:hypothetical protein
MIAKIIDIIDSDREKKRYKVVLNNGKTYNFGSRGSQTYIDHHDKQKRDAYLKRHTASPLERNLIMNLVPSPALFSAALLWGPHMSLYDNINHLNEVFEKNNIEIV